MMNGFWIIAILLLWLVPGVVLFWERGVFDGFSRRTSNRKLMLFAPFFLLLLTYAQKPQNQPEVTLPSRQGAMQQTEQSADRMRAELKLSGVVPVCITNSVWSDWTNGTEYVPWLTVPVRKAVVKLELPFAFPVGTNVYSNIYVSASGVIGFDRPRGSVVPESLPCAYGTNGVFLALAWGDNMFKPGRGSRLRYGVESNSFCVLMEEVFSGTNVFSAKAELFDNGNVILKYRDLPADHVVGLQNRLGGWQVATNGTFEVFCRYFGWADPAKIDTDEDGLDDYDEIYICGTDPRVIDSDGDGLSDGEEVLVCCTDPLCQDSDGDSVPDGWEVQHGYNPLLYDPADLDKDELYDYWEELHGTDPSDPDTDGDSMPDGWEIRYGLNPLFDDSAEDADGDGLSNFEEWLNGTNPQSADTDGDGAADGIEIGAGADPVDPSDSGQVPYPEEVVDVSFCSGGDYASWLMKVEGTTPGDRRVLRFQTGRPGNIGYKTFRLRQRCSYRITLTWVKSVPDPSYTWYCWEAQIDGLPENQTYTSYSPVRLLGEEIVVGPGWVARNTGGLLTPHVHMRSGADGGGNVAGNLWAELTVLKIAMVTPSGDPVLAPTDYGIRQNEYAFTSGSPGTLTMNLQAEVSPGWAAALIKDQTRFDVANIGETVAVWGALHPNGRATYASDFLYASVSYSGLPTDNGSFGRKTAAVVMKGKSMAEAPYEVFYEKNAYNHPFCPTCDCPNWYYYWRQTWANGANTTMVYSPDEQSCYKYSDGRKIVIGDDAALEQNSSWKLPFGIDCFAWTTRHEAKHHTQISGFWPISRNPTNDVDGDWIPNSVEATYMPGRPYSPTNPRTYPDGVGYGGGFILDIEDICMRSQVPPYEVDMLWINGQANQVDWARPGKNSISRY